MKKTLAAALALTAALLGTNLDAATKRRAVSPPVPPSALVALNGSDVTVTNNGTAASVKHCLEDVCSTDSIQPGQTIVYTALPADKLLEVTAPIGVEVHSGIEPFSYNTENQVVPTFDPNLYTMRLAVISRNHATLDVRFLGDNGVQRDVKGIELQRGINYLNPTELFGLSGNQQLELSAPGFIEFTNKQTGKKTIIPSIPLSQAVGEQYVPYAEAGSQVTIKNPDPAHITGVSIDTFGTSANELTTIPVINYGIETRDHLTSQAGALRILGGVFDNTRQPSIVWTRLNGDYIPATTQAAQERSTDAGDQREEYDLSFGGVNNTTKLLYFNVSGATTGNVHVTDADGKEVKVIPVSFGQQQGITIDLNQYVSAGSYHAILKLDKGQNFIQPTVTGIAAVIANGQTSYRRGTQVKREAVKVTAQDYVDHFLVPLKNSRAYLSNNETTRMIRGDGGTKSFALDLASIIQPAYASSWPTPQALADQLVAWTDGNDANGEIYNRSDPFAYNNTGSPLNVGLLMKPAGGGIPFNLSSSQMDQVYSVVRSFLIAYATAHPEVYGATSETGFNLNLNPTWNTKDSN